MDYSLGLGAARAVCGPHHIITCIGGTDEFHAAPVRGYPLTQLVCALSAR